MRWEKEPKKRLRNREPISESKKEGEGEDLFSSLYNQILVLFSQLKYKRNNPLLLTTIIVNKKSQNWKNSDNNPKAFH